MRGLTAINLRAIAFALACVTLFASAQADALSRNRRDVSSFTRAKPAPLQAEKGPYHIVVSLASQSLRVFDAGGRVVMTSRVSTGQSGHRTPIGIFSVLQKRRYHESNIYSGVPMPFMQRITWSGIALHEGVLPGYPASHGCIRLPGGVARSLFSMTGVGERVIVVDGQISPKQFDHPRLFARDPGSSTSSPRSAERPSSAQLAQSEPGNDATPLDTKLAVPDPVRARTQPKEPIAIFVSRREQKLYVRQNFAPLFDVPIDVRDPDVPLGTHLFTAVAPDDQTSKMRWMVVSFPDEKETIKSSISLSSASDRGRRSSPRSQSIERTWRTPPGAALDRITIPDGALGRIAEMITTGSSFLISDQGLGLETGKGTDFIVLRP